MSLSVAPAHAPKYLKSLTSFSTVPSVVVSGRCSWLCHKLWPHFIYFLIYFAFSLRSALAHSNCTLARLWERNFHIIQAKVFSCLSNVTSLCASGLVRKLNKSRKLRHNTYVFLSNAWTLVWWLVRFLERVVNMEKADISSLLGWSSDSSNNFASCLQFSDLLSWEFQFPIQQQIGEVLRTKAGEEYCSYQLAPLSDCFHFPGCAGLVLMFGLRGRMTIAMM